MPRRNKKNGCVKSNYCYNAWDSFVFILSILRSLRELGMSQKDFAEKIGVSPQVVNRWVKGKENFTFETISKLEEALHIEILHVS